MRVICRFYNGSVRKDSKRIIRPPLISALQSCNESLAVKLIEDGAEVNGSRYGKAPLAEAAGCEIDLPARLLLEHGAKVDTRCLNYAVEYGHYAAAKLLIAHGADVNGKARHFTKD
jgi:ankyrin repeat protein